MAEIEQSKSCFTKLKEQSAKIEFKIYELGYKAPNVLMFNSILEKREVLEIVENEIYSITKGRLPGWEDQTYKLAGRINFSSMVVEVFSNQHLEKMQELAKFLSEISGMLVEALKVKIGYLNTFLTIETPKGPTI